MKELLNKSQNNVLNSKRPLYVRAKLIMTDKNFISIDPLNMPTYALIDKNEEIYEFDLSYNERMLIVKSII